MTKVKEFFSLAGASGGWGGGGGRCIMGDVQVEYK